MTQLELFPNILTASTYDDFVESMWVGATNLGTLESELNFIGLAICEEAGEVAGKLKKLSRGDGNITVKMIAQELGDTLYYITKLGNKIGYTLESLLLLNATKLTERHAKGTLKGSGDNR